MKRYDCFFRLVNILLILTVGLIALNYSNFNAFAQEEGGYVEEDADTLLPGDEVLSGLVTWQKGPVMVINEETYPLCRTIKVFNEKGQAIKRNLLKEAEKVKAFYSKRDDCVRKVKVLKFKS